MVPRLHRWIGRLGRPGREDSNGRGLPRRKEEMKKKRARKKEMKKERARLKINSKNRMPCKGRVGMRVAQVARA